MNVPQIFSFNDAQIRVVEKDGQPWFVAKDVCEIIGLSQVSRAMDRLDDDERGLVKVTHPQNPEKTLEVNAVNESGLYQLIIASNKPEARTFRKWITSEVLPTIRKTGGYVADDDAFIATYLPYADEQTKATFRATLALVRKQNEQIAAMRPKAEYFDALVDRNLLTNFRDTAKELRIRQTDFIKWLLDKRYLYRDQKGRLKPYAQFVPELFQLKEWARGEKADVQTLITPKGRETFRLLLERRAG
jgi:prophage antirepressor-like protein